VITISDIDCLIRINCHTTNGHSVTAFYGQRARGLDALIDVDFNSCVALFPLVSPLLSLCLYQSYMLLKQTITIGSLLF